MEGYEYSQSTDYYGQEASTDIWFYKNIYGGLTVDCDINTPRMGVKGVEVQQCVIVEMPDEEGIKLRDYLISISPL